jgi:acylphosphatase
MADLVGCRIVVSGRVQGVWFRETVRRSAERHGVAGFLRNLPDGTVEALFEGRPAEVHSLIEVCRRGPSDARVDRIVVREEPLRGLHAFEVL